MTTGLSITITQATGGNLGGSRRSEKQEYSDLLERLQQVLVSSAQATTSFTISDRNGGSNLTATYTPVASS